MIENIRNFVLTEGFLHVGDDVIITDRAIVNYAKEINALIETGIKRGWFLHELDELLEKVNNELGKDSTDLLVEYACHLVKNESVAQNTETKDNVKYHIL